MIGRPLRRALRVTGGSWAGFLACLAVAMGVVDPAAPMSAARPAALAIILFASILLVLVTAVSRRIRFEEPSARAQRVSRWMRMASAFADLEVALALVAGMYALLAVTGGLQSEMYPLLYAVVAFSATFQRRSAAVATTIAVLLLEGSSLYRFGASGLTDVLFHLAFVCGAALVHAVFLRGLIAAIMDCASPMKSEIGKSRRATTA
jgi:hypothetical protein